MSTQEKSMKPLFNGLGMSCLAAFFVYPLIITAGLAFLPEKTGLSETFWLAILLPIASGAVIFSFFKGYRSQKEVDLAVQKEVEAWRASKAKDDQQ